MTRTAENRAWLRGFAAALGAVKRLYGEDTIVEQVMVCDGITFSMLRKAGVDNFDMRELRAAVCPERRKRLGLA